MTQATSRLKEPAEECYDTLDQVSYCYNTLDQVSCCYDTLDQASCCCNTLDNMKLGQVCRNNMKLGQVCRNNMKLGQVCRNNMKLLKKKKKMYFVKTEFCSSYSFLFYWIVSQFTKFVPFINQTITHILNSMGIVKKTVLSKRVTHRH
jgi:hypothetical protein